MDGDQNGNSRYRGTVWDDEKVHRGHVCDIVCPIPTDGCTFVGKYLLSYFYISWTQSISLHSFSFLVFKKFDLVSPYCNVILRSGLRIGLERISMGGGAEQIGALVGDLRLGAEQKIFWSGSERSRKICSVPHLWPSSPTVQQKPEFG